MKALLLVDPNGCGPVPPVKRFLVLLFKRCGYYLRYLQILRCMILKPSFNSLSIEINSSCNRRCKYCPNFKHRRESVFLDDSLVHKMIDELESARFKGRIGFSLFNEPLLDKRIFGFIKYARQKLPGAHIYLNTNGDLLNLTTWRALREAGLDSADVTQHDEKINDNIQSLLDALDPEERKHLYVHFLYSVNNRAGLIEVDHSVELPLQRYCDRPFYQLCINYEGKAVLCCNDYFGQVDAGDVRKESLSTIWNSEVFKHYRRKLFRADRAGLKLCDQCDCMKMVRASLRDNPS